MKVVNCTPHPVKVNGVTIPPTGTVARVEDATAHVADVDMDGTDVAFPLYQLTAGEVIGLALAEGADYVIVSRPVAERLADPRMVCPYDFVRDAEGSILGCLGLAYFYKGEGK